MRRRKLMIGLGALTAGGSAAFGTEAFTSVEAQRNVDVAVAGDQSAFIAIQPLSSDNAGKYVSTEGDDTVQLNFDGDNEGPGEGVSQDAITQVEDLFRIVNQGSQPSSVYFEDSSDAVTFRVTQSTDTSTTDSSGQTLEGADNSVELAVGEQVVVGMTINTLEEEVNGQLLDSVTLYAEAGASAPEQSIPQPEYVVDSDAFGDSDNDADSNDENIFPSISEAVSAAEPDAIVGVRNAPDIDSRISINKPLTLSGFEGKPPISVTTDQEGGEDEAIAIESDNVTIQNLDLNYDGLSRDNDTHLISGIGRKGITLRSLEIKSNASYDTNAIDIRGVDLEIINNVVTDAGIQVQHGSASSSGGSVTISGNSVSESDGSGGIKDEGIVAFTIEPADLADFSYTIENNKVRDVEPDAQAIKLTDLVENNNPADVNGESDKQDQIEALLGDNDVFSARIEGSNGAQFTSGSTFSSIQETINVANNGVALVDSGSYTESVEITTSDLTLKGIDSPTIEGDGESAGSQPYAAIHVNDDNGPVRNVTVEGFTVRNPDGKYGIFAGTGTTNSDDDGISGLVIRDNVVKDISTQSTGSALTGGPAGIGIRADYGTDENAGIEIDSNVINNVQNESGPEPTGITLKSFTGDAGFGKDSSGDSVTDSSSPPATNTDIVNNMISEISSGGGYATKGISVSGEFEDVVVNANTLTEISSPGGTAIGVTFSENSGSYGGNEYDIDDDDNGERIGPRDFEIKNNEFRAIDAEDPRSVNIGGYEDLEGSGDAIVKNNNFIDTGAVVTRFAGNQAGYQISDGDELDADNNYWGAPSGPSGEDGVPGGTGAPAVTGGEDDNGTDRNGKVNASDGSHSSDPISDAGSTL